MVGQSSVTNMDNSFLRKTRKPAVEKKRRDRINTSISTLKMFLAQSCNATSTPKLDKADILEQTVNHLVQLQNQHSSISMATQVAAYKTGFKESARETIRFLSATQTMDVDSLGVLNAHLQNAYLNTTTPASVFAKTRLQLKRHSSSHVRNASVSMDTSRGYHDDDYLPSPINRASFSSSVSSDSEISLSSSDTSGSTSNYSDICWSNSSVSSGSDSDVSSVNYSDKDLRDIVQEEQPWRPW